MCQQLWRVFYHFQYSLISNACFWPRNYTPRVCSSLFWPWPTWSIDDIHPSFYNSGLTATASSYIGLSVYPFENLMDGIYDTRIRNDYNADQASNECWYAVDLGRRAMIYGVMIYNKEVGQGRKWWNDEMMTDFCFEWYFLCYMHLYKAVTSQIKKCHQQNFPFIRQ